jgi:hypothetical protein
MKHRSVSFSIPSTINASSDEYSYVEQASANISDKRWPGATGRIEASLSIPRRAFASEDVITASLKVLNHSSSSAMVDKMQIHQTVKYSTLGEYVSNKNANTPNLSMFINT